MKKLFRFLLTAIIAVAFAAAPAFAQKDEQPPKPPSAEKAARPKKPPVTGKLNVNTATAEQIAMLPGVSLKKARDLVEYRTKNGTFKDMDDLRKLPGVKPKKLEKLKDLLIFEGESTLAPVK